MNNELKHHGVKGMRWGVRKEPDRIRTLRIRRNFNQGIVNLRTKSVNRYRLQNENVPENQQHILNIPYQYRKRRIESYENRKDIIKTIDELIAVNGDISVLAKYAEIDAGRLYLEYSIDRMNAKRN